MRTRQLLIFLSVKYTSQWSTTQRSKSKGARPRLTTRPAQKPIAQTTTPLTSYIKENNLNLTPTQTAYKQDQGKKGHTNHHFHGNFQITGGHVTFLSLKAGERRTFSVAMEMRFPHSTSISTHKGNPKPYSTWTYPYNTMIPGMRFPFQPSKPNQSVKRIRKASTFDKWKLTLWPNFLIWTCAFFFFLLSGVCSGEGRITEEINSTMLIYTQRRSEKEINKSKENKDKKKRLGQTQVVPTRTKERNM